MKENYFNSVSEYTQIIAQYEGCSSSVIRRQMNEVGFRFENHQVIYPNKLPEFLQKDRIPNYILKTCKDDNVPSLRRREYDILVYLSRSSKYFEFLWNEENEVLKERTKDKRYPEFFNLDWTPTNFISIKKIAENTGYSVCEIQTSFKKLQFYFDGFHRKPNANESIERKYKFSRSYTKNLPERSEWKKIIESKLNPELEFSLPKIINKDQYLRWQKLVRKHMQTQPSYVRLMDLSQYRKMLKEVDLVLDKMRTGRSKWDQINFDYNRYLLYINRLKEDKKKFLLDCIWEEIEELRQSNEEILKKYSKYKVKTPPIQDEIDLHNSVLGKLSLIKESWDIIEMFTEDTLEDIIRHKEDKLSILMYYLLEAVEELENKYQIA